MRAPDEAGLAAAAPDDVAVDGAPEKGCPAGEDACWVTKLGLKLGLGTNGDPDRHRRERVDWRSTRTSAVGSFLGILAVSLIQHAAGVPAVTGAFAASAVLLYDAYDSPLAQPRNLVGGHAISAVIGVTVWKALGARWPWLANAAAVALAIAAMDVTGTLHPPGGATALIACIGPDRIHDLGYRYVLYPVLLGAATLLVVALVTNNLDPRRRYPLWWY